VLVIAATERELAHVRRFDTFSCGIGPVEAALNTGRALADRKPDAVLHIGIAGSRTLPQLSLVLGSESVFEDAQSPLVPTRADPDEALLARLREALPEARVLPIGTSARVGGTSRCDVEAMEGFSVLRACELAGVPAVELRAISNSPDEADRSKWSFEPAFELLGAALDRLDVV
jgi:predicted 5'-methylthioadenosine/S-adenosylhomocysteine nucleosidase